MRTGIAKLASLTLISLAFLPSPAVAEGKLGCLLFCGDSKSDKKADAKPAAKDEAPATPSVDLNSAILQAQTARKANDLNGAAKILSQLVLFAPDDARVMGEYGKTLAAQGRTDDALAFLERALQLTPNDWSLYSAQGVAYDQKGIYQAAQGAYSRALALKPNDPTVLNNAALSRMQAGDLDGAHTLLMQASPATNYPKIAENLAFVDRLIAARPQVAPPPVTRPSIVPTAPASPQPPAAVAAAPMAAPAPAPVAAPAAPPVQVAAAPTEPKPVIAMSKVETAPLAEPKAEAPVSAAPKAEAKPAEVPASISPQLAALKADPTVKMAPIPKEEPPAPAPKKLTVPPPATEKRVIVASNTPPKAAVTRSNSNYYVQAGAYSSEERAGKLAHDLDALGARVSPAKVDGRDVYRVRIGPFLDKEQASEAASQAQSMGHPDLKIVSDQ